MAVVSTVREGDFKPEKGILERTTMWPPAEAVCSPEGGKEGGSRLSAVLDRLPGLARARRVGVHEGGQ